MTFLGRLAQGQYDPAREYDFKAVYLYRFALLTTWAPEAFPDPQAPFVLGILGEDPWRGQLANKLRASVNQRKLEVRLCGADLEQAKGCHLLFIAKSEKERLGPILDALKDTKVFTVVEGDRPLETDGVINLYVDSSLKFVLNEEAAERARLTIGSELKEAAAKRFRKKRS
jgi:hypothetical protein